MEINILGSEKQKSLNMFTKWMFLVSSYETEYFVAVKARSPRYFHVGYHGDLGSPAQPGKAVIKPTASPEAFEGFQAVVKSTASVASPTTNEIVTKKRKETRSFGSLDP